MTNLSFSVNPRPFVLLRSSFLGERKVVGREYCGGGVRRPDELIDAERVDASEDKEGVDEIGDKFDGNGGGGFKGRCEAARSLSAMELFARLGWGMDIP